MNHDEIKDRLLSFEDAELDPREKVLLAEHLKDCGECRARLESWKQSSRALTDVKDPAPSEKFVLNVMQNVEALEAKSHYGWKIPEWLLPAAGYAFAAVLMIVVVNRPLFAEDTAVNTEEVLLADMPEQTQWVLANESNNDVAPLINIVEGSL